MTPYNEPMPVGLPASLFRRVTFQEGDDGPLTEVEFVPVNEENEDW